MKTQYHHSFTTITVGGPKADISGTDGRAIQMAVDALSERGGGTVKLTAPEYILSGPVRMKSNVRLSGKGVDKTVLKRIPAAISKLARDADTGEKQFTPAEPEKFKPGMGIIFMDGPKEYGMATMPRTITHIKNGVCYLDDYINKDRIAEKGALAANYFIMVHAFGQSNIRVDSLTLDGKVENPPAGWNNIWGGNLYFRRSTECLFADLKSINANGDGIRFGQSPDNRVIRCEMAHNSHYGMHPGSHSKRAEVHHCDIHHNGSDGLYVCWGVADGKFTNNKIHHNGYRIFRTGFCIGHKDTNCVVADNHIYNNAKHGIHVRKKTESNGAHGCIFRNNIIENNGTAEADIPVKLTKAVPLHTLLGAGVFVNGITHGLVFENNTVRDTRKGKERLQLNGFWFDPGVTESVMKGNKISGHPKKGVVDKTGNKTNTLEK